MHYGKPQSRLLCSPDSYLAERQRGDAVLAHEQVVLTPLGFLEIGDGHSVRSLGRKEDFVSFRSTAGKLVFFAIEIELAE